jgi:hypothetical protein
VFVNPPKSAFPLIGLEVARVTLLDDWRFNEDLVPFNLQLLWFEGKGFLISRPQNQFSGHLRYAADAPIFISTLEADITTLKRGIQAGDISMMMKRLKVFPFHHKLVNPDRSLQACGRCFAKFVLSGAGVLSRSGDAQSSGLGPSSSSIATSSAEVVLPTEEASVGTDTGSKRRLDTGTGSSPEAKRAVRSTWSVDEVLQFLVDISLRHVCEVFRENGVDGQFLTELDEAELVSELGLTKLQAKKIKSRFR